VEFKETTKKECPECGSKNINYYGVSTGTGIVGPKNEIPEVNKHKFKCQEKNCGVTFWFIGKRNTL